MKSRTGGGGLYAAVAAICLVVGRPVFFAFAVLLGLGAGGELYRLARARGAKPVALVGLAGIVALLVTGYLRAERAPTFLPLVIAAVTAAALVALLLRRRRAEVTRAIAYTLLPVMTIGLLGAYVLAMRAAPDGFRLVAALLGMAFAADAGPWLLRTIRHQGAHAHPQPVWERAGASLVGAAVAAAIVAITLDPPFSFGRALVLGVVVAAVSQVTEGLASTIEDDLSHAEPGVRRPRAHLFRRLDAALLAAPFFYYAFRVLAR